MHDGMLGDVVATMRGACMESLSRRRQCLHLRLDGRRGERELATAALDASFAGDRSTGAPALVPDLPKPLDHEHLLGDIVLLHERPRLAD